MEYYGFQGYVTKTLVGIQFQLVEQFTQILNKDSQGIY
jgi:hypothetical protein